MKLLISRLALLACLHAAAPAGAAPVLSLDRVGVGSIGLGQSTTFQLRLANPSELVGAFSVDIAFDPNVLSFEPTPTLALQFGPHLGNPDLVEALGDASSAVAGVLHLDEVSLLDTVSLDSLQRDAGGSLLSDLLLAQINFRAVGAGLGSLAFMGGTAQFSDAAGNAWVTPLLAPPDGVAVVPEPATATLVGLALLAGFATRRRT